MGGTATTVRAPRGVLLDSLLLRSARQELNLTQRDVAELAGITTRTYQSAEQGQRISAGSARSICVALGTPFASLRRYSAERIRERLAAAGYGPLPPPSPWGARDDETRAILPQLGRADGHGVTCCLAGPSGIGKTALARWAVASLEPEFPDGIVWVTASRNESEGAAAATMATIAQELGFAPRLPDPRAVSADTFHQAFRQNLWARRRLLVLDDVASVKQGTRFVGQGEGGPVLLTTMFRSVGAELGEPFVEIGPMSTAAASELLAAHIGEERAADDPGGLRSLTELLGGIPRTVQIAGQMLKQERLTTLSDYANRVDALTKSGADAPRFDRDESFASAYLQLRDRVSDAGWRLFGDLSVFGDSSFVPSWAAAAAQRSALEINAQLSELADLYLVQEATPVERAGGTTRWFALDAQAERVARTVASPAESELVRRLLSAARDEALRIEAFDLDEGVRALEEGLPLLRRCFDLAVPAILPADGPRVLSSPDDTPQVDTAALSLFELLPEVLAPLRSVLRLRPLPETGTWMSAAMVVAEFNGARLAHGRLASLLGHWWALNAVDFAAVHRLDARARDELLEEGALEEAFSAWFYAGCGLLSSQGPAASLPVYEELARWTRGTDLSSSMNAVALQAVGFSLALKQGSTAETQRAGELFEESVELCTGDGWHERLMRAASLVSLAVLRKRRREALPEEDLHEALTTLIELAGDDQFEVWRLEHIGGYVGLPGWADGGAISERRQREILLGVPSDGVPGRLVKLMSGAFVQNLPGASPDVRRAGLDGSLSMLEIVIGTRTEVELGHLVGVLCPTEVFSGILDERGCSLARTFVEQTCGGASPALQIINHLAASKGWTL